MSTLALIISLLALDIVIWPKIKQSWIKPSYEFTSVFWAVLGGMFFVMSMGVIFSLLLTHITFQ